MWRDYQTCFKLNKQIWPKLKMSQLKLIALDAEDLKIISSCCQDALTRIGELRYHAREQKFILPLNRFVWEDETRKERRQAVLHFEKVMAVKTSGINLNAKDVLLSLLTVIFEETDAPNGIIELVFAGDGAIRLEVECVEAKLSDLAAAWSASSTPNHE